MALPALAQAPPAVGGDCPIVAPKPRASGVRLVEGPVWTLQKARLFAPDSLAMAPGALVDPARGEIHFLFRFDSSTLEPAAWERATAEIGGESFELVAMGPPTKTARGERVEESLMVAVPAALVERARGGAPVDGWLYGAKPREFALSGEQAACLGRLLDAARDSLGADAVTASAPAASPAPAAAPAAVAPVAPMAPMAPVAPVAPVPQTVPTSPPAPTAPTAPIAPNTPIPPAPAVAPPAPARPTLVSGQVVGGEPLPSYLRELWELAKLRDAGVLTQEEFERKKKQVLERSEGTAAPPPEDPAPPPG